MAKILQAGKWQLLTVQHEKVKSKAQILAEQIDKIFEERGIKVKMKESKKEGTFVYIPKQKSSSSINRKSQIKKGIRNGRL